MPARALLCGLGDVIAPPRALLALSPSELRRAACGEATIAWSVASLRQTVQVGTGYSQASPAVGWLLELLVAVSFSLAS